MTRRELLKSRFKNAYSRKSHLRSSLSTELVTINVPTFKAWEGLHYWYLKKLRKSES